MAIEEGPVDPSTRLAAVFEKLNISAAFNDRLKTTGKKVLWAVHDYNKFGVLLQDAKYFIDGLQDITKEIVTLRNQQRYFETRINSIDDPETLNMIAEVCLSDHPTFSDAASHRAEGISCAVTEKPEVTQWLQETVPDEGLASTIEDMESWSYTELRERYLALYHKNREQLESDDYESLQPLTFIGFHPGTDTCMLRTFDEFGGYHVTMSEPSYPISFEELLSDDLMPYDTASYYKAVIDDEMQYPTAPETQSRTTSTPLTAAS